MKRNFSRAIALVLILVTALSLMPMAGAATVMYAKTDVNVRSGPGTNYAVLGYLDRGDAVTATGTVVGNWTQIQFSRYELGYVSSSYLTNSYSSGNSYYQVCSPSSAKLRVCPDCGDIYYATTALNVRSGPGTNYSIVGSLNKGDRVSCLGKSGNWYKVRTPNGTVGYCYKSYLSSTAVSTSSYGKYCCDCGVVVCNSNGCYINGGTCYNNKYYCGSCYNYGFNWTCTPSYPSCSYTLRTGDTYKIKYGIMLYSEPSTSSGATHTLLAGTRVTLISGVASKQAWVRVKVNECGCYGYIPLDAIV